MEQLEKDNTINYLLNKHKQKLINEEREEESQEERDEKNRSEDKDITFTSPNEATSNNTLEYLKQKHEASQNEKAPLSYLSQRNMYQADEKGDDHTLPDNNIPSVENEDANKNESNKFRYISPISTFLDNLTGVPSAITSVADDLYNTNYKKAIIHGGADAYSAGLRTVGAVMEGTAKTAPLPNSFVFANLISKLISGDQPTKIEELVKEKFPEYTERMEKQFTEDFVLYKLANGIQRETEKEFAL